MLLWTSAGIFVFSILALLTMLGCWTYSDAKIRSGKPEIWVLIVLLVPNFIGLIIYLLIGRTKESEGPKPPGNKFFKPLAAFGILTILAFAAVMTFAILVPIP